MRDPRPPTYTGGTKIARQGLALSATWPTYQARLAADARSACDVSSWPGLARPIRAFEKGLDARIKPARRL